MFLALIGFLALGPQVVFSFTRLKLSQPTQCSPFTVDFKGNGSFGKSFTPSTLTILPFNSVPVSIPLPPTTTNTTTLNISFVPIPAGGNFIATVDNPANLSVALVSDIIRVLPSNQNSCLPSQTVNTSPSPFAIINDTVSQCQNFTVSYNTSVAPSVRLFIPNGFSAPLPKVSEGNGSAVFTMKAFRGKQVILLFDDERGNRRTSSLLSVLGDSSSPNCFNNLNGNIGGKNMTASDNAIEPNKPSKGVVIGLGVGGALIFLIALAMLFFLLRERRRKRALWNKMNLDRPGRVQPNDVERAMEEKKRKSLPLPPVPQSQIYPDGFVVDPPYVSEKYSPTISDYPRTSISWEVIDGEGNTVPRKSITASAHLSSIDIERMLELAANQNSSNDSSIPLSPSPLTAARSPSLTPPERPTAAYRDISPPDIPHNPSFFFSNDPTYAEMHGFSSPAQATFFESPHSMDSPLRRNNDEQSSYGSSNESRLSHDSSSQRISVPFSVLQRPTNGIPSTPMSDEWENPRRSSLLMRRPSELNTLRFPEPVRDRASGGRSSSPEF